MQKVECFVCGKVIPRNVRKTPINSFYYHTDTCSPGSDLYLQNLPLASEYCRILGRDDVTFSSKDVLIGGVYLVYVFEGVAQHPEFDPQIPGRTKDLRKVRVERKAGGGWASRDLESKEEIHVPFLRCLRAEVKTENTEPAIILLAAKKILRTESPLSCKALVKGMIEKDYWKTEAKRPYFLVYKTLMAEIEKQGSECEIRKAGIGKFGLAEEVEPQEPEKPKKKRGRPPKIKTETPKEEKPRQVTRKKPGAGKRRKKKG